MIWHLTLISSLNRRPTDWNLWSAFLNLYGNQNASLESVLSCCTWYGIIIHYENSSVWLGWLLMDVYTSWVCIEKINHIMFTTGKRRSLKGVINVGEITKWMISDQVHNSVAEILFFNSFHRCQHYAWLFTVVLTPNFFFHCF